MKFVNQWMLSHIEDGDKLLNKPVLFTEFGLSNLNKDFEPSQRDELYQLIFDIIYNSAKRNKSGAGTIIWQFLVDGMEEYNDDFGFVPWEKPSLYKLVTEQSCRLTEIHGLIQYSANLKVLCAQRQ